MVAIFSEMSYASTPIHIKTLNYSAASQPHLSLSGRSYSKCSILGKTMEELGSNHNGYYIAGGRSESSLEATPPIQPIPTTRNTKANTSTTKVTKSSTVAKSSAGPRFQCAKCPKNFSRIENLTRHQANRKSNIGNRTVEFLKKYTWLTL